MSVKRGDIYYADLSPVIGSEQGGVRPVLIIQNDMMNEAFMLMGNKKELTSLGAITGGKASSNPDLNNFIRVDIRYFTELEIPSSKPKIITTMPASAYTITNNGNGTSILKILNPTEFWKISKILIIQLR